MRLDELPTPAYVVDEKKLLRNLEILNGVERRTGCRILLAQKAFSMFSLYPLVRQYLSGTASSGLFEARLSHEEFKKENHVFAPAYKTEEFEELCGICDHIVFNSFSQLEKHRSVWLAAKKSVGIRINPEYSTQKGRTVYDPCAPFSRLGVTAGHFREDLLDGVEGLHFHTLCEQDSGDLVRTFAAAEEKFGVYFKRMKWLNLGGGHHITRSDYDLTALEGLILRAEDKYGVQVYLEPGEAVALNAGYLIAQVLDVVSNGMEILILDASAACHMPDVLEMPYRPPLRDSGKAGERAFTYRLSSLSCLAGDVVGDYSFDRPIKAGDRLCFEDMAIYTMVKNNTFNGIPLPAIAVLCENGDCELVKTFGYRDFKERLS